jgi:energy-coupling factor transporter ATP-binding protein EcfA2
MNNSWIKIYGIIAEQVYQFFEKYKNESGRELYKRCMSLDYREDFIKLNPWIKKFEKFEVISLDPLHIFASFNSWKISQETKKEKIRLYYKILTNENFAELDKIDLDVFKYFPHIQITRVVGARGELEQQLLWNFFYLIVKKDINIDKIEELFDNILGFNSQHQNVYGVRLPILTIFMFWVNSDKFLPLDKNTYGILKNLNKNFLANQRWQEYVRLIDLNNEINISKSLYRNLTFLAIDFKSKYSKITKIFTNNEINEIENYFYFMRTGNYNSKQDEVGIKKNIFNEIAQVEQTELMKQFTILAIKPLKECGRQYHKKLERDKMYCLNNDYLINDDGAITYQKDKDLDLYSEKQGLKMNFQAIVGKNGEGKSTIIELLSMIIANIAFKSGVIYVDDDIQQEFNNLAVELYFVMEGIYKVECKNGEVNFYQYFSSETENTFRIQYNAISNNEYLNNFFYTIHTNYSLYSLNESDDGFKWLNPLFHKNDAYQTPIVIEPFRINGSVDVNRLTSLTKQRLISRILQPFDIANNEDVNTFTRLIEDSLEYKDATHIDISLDIKNLKSMIRNKRESIHRTKKFFDPDFEDALNEVLSSKYNYDIVENISKLCNINISEVYQDVNSSKWTNQGDGQMPIFSNNIVDTETQYTKITLLYICNKVEKIANTYTEFKEYKDDFANREFLQQLLNDQTHITHKLHQAINFLKYGTVVSLGKVDVKELSNRIEMIQEKNPEIPTIRLIPPSFFNIDIILNNEIPFNTLSSGEKQLIYTITSIVYHLQNLSSVHKTNNNKMAYKYINIVLDEIELYFHPEFQRKFIFNLCKALENFSGLEESDILGLNFLLITHSPFILSDVLDDKILFLKNNKNGLENIKTFGANIHELLSDGFFMEDGLIGEYAKTILKEIVDFLNHKNKLYDEKKDYLYQLINYIGEDFLREKLMQMYDVFYNTQKDLILARLKEKEAEIQKQIKELEE